MKRIIIVDDDEAIQDAFRLIFSPEEYEVTIFHDAAPLLKNNFTVPDVFILDKQLRGVDGLELCRILKERESTRNIPVIVLSASPNIRKLAEICGADEVIEKPFKIKTLRETVRKLLFRGGPNTG